MRRRPRAMPRWPRARPPSPPRRRRRRCPSAGPAPGPRLRSAARWGRRRARRARRCPWGRRTCAPRSTPAVAGCVAEPTGSQGTACTASVCRTAVGARSRRRSPIVSSGWMVPTSLFTSITDTTTVRSSSASASASRSTIPSRPAPTRTTRNPSRSRRSHDARTALCSKPTVTTPSPRPAARAARAAPFTARLSASLPPAVNTTSPGLAPSARGDRLPGLFEGGLRRAVPPRAPRGVAEDAGQERRHRGDGFGPHGRGRGVVEVGTGRHHGHPVYERPFRAPARVKGCDLERWRNKSLPIAGPRATHDAATSRAQRASCSPGANGREPGIPARSERRVVGE